MLAALLVLASVVDLSPELRTAADRASLPAIQATVTKSAGNGASGTTGIAVLDRPMRVRATDPFHIGSCAKPFTATIVAMLVEERKLDWETKIADVFPEWKDVMQPAYSSVTLADLLSHESGLPAFGDDADFVGLPPFPGATVERRRAFARYVLTLPPAAPPRSAYVYSNAGFVVAAAMADKVSGRPWEWWIRKRIFRPLHMRSAGIGWPRRVWGHEAADDGRLTPVDPRGKYQLPDYLAPAGDLQMSADDLAAFLRAHLRAMRGEKTLISPATSAALHTKRLRSALGFGSAAVAGFENVATYSGSAGTFFTVIAIAADGDVAVAVSANAGNEAAQKTVGQLLKGYLARFATSKAE